MLVSQGIFAQLIPGVFWRAYIAPTSPARAAVDGDRRGRGRQAWGIVTPRGSGLTGAETVPLTDPRNEILPPARRLRLILIPRGVRASRAPLIFPGGTWAGLHGEGPGHRMQGHGRNFRTRSSIKPPRSAVARPQNARRDWRRPARPFGRASA